MQIKTQFKELKNQVPIVSAKYKTNKPKCQLYMYVQIKKLEGS